uniref:Uncharacterized protein n=1 Tax=Acrobeloides nanus TaxID=290746 RepID=A0A914BZK7_9BILA
MDIHKIVFVSILETVLVALFPMMFGKARMLEEVNDLDKTIPIISTLRLQSKIGRKTIMVVLFPIMFDAKGIFKKIIDLIKAIP